MSTKYDTACVNLVLKTVGTFFAWRVDAPQKFSRVVEFLHFRAISTMCACSFFLALRSRERGEGEGQEEEEKEEENEDEERRGGQSAAINLRAGRTRHKWFKIQTISASLRFRASLEGLLRGDKCLSILQSDNSRWTVSRGRGRGRIPCACLCPRRTLAKARRLRDESAKSN